MCGEPLHERWCTPLPDNWEPLPEGEVNHLLSHLEGEWTLRNGTIVKEMEFEDAPQAISFVNAAAWVGLLQRHWPSIEVKGKRCTVTLGEPGRGLSENDFVVAARIDRLLR